MCNNIITFKKSQCWVSGFSRAYDNVKSGVYCDGVWVGHIIKGNAFYPSQIKINGVLSPKLTPKPGAKGKIKPLIRNLLVQWVKNELNRQQTGG